MATNNKMILITIILGTFMTALDATIVSVALPTMAKEFGEQGFNVNNISWVMLSYTLMMCCFILLWAKLGTNKGYKKIFTIGIFIFAATSGAIGAVGLFPQLGLGIIILLRAVQGIGAGMVMAVSLAMVSAYLPQDIRGRSIGAVTLAASAGTAFGPALGGVLTTVHWSYIFFINIPIGIAVLLLSLKFMKVEDRLPTEKKKLDVVGTILMFAMMFALIFYLNKGADIGWTSPLGIALLFVTFIAAGLVVFWEQRAKDPIINMRLFSEKYINRAHIIQLLLFGSIGGCYLLLPYFLQYVKGFETIQYGFILIANSVGMMVAGPVVGKMADKTGNNKIWIVSGTLIMAVGLLMFTFFDANTELWYILISLFVMGAGASMALVGSTNLAFENIKEGEDGELSGLTNTFRQAGSSAGVAILNAVFTAGLFMAGTTVADKIMPGLKHAFFIAVIIALIAFVVSISVKNKKDVASE